jgi:hypothetical protein
MHTVLNLTHPLNTLTFSILSTFAPAQNVLPMFYLPAKISCKQLVFNVLNLSFVASPGIEPVSKV